MYVVHISACMCAFYFSQYPKRNNHTLQSHSVFCTVYCCVHCIAEIVLVRRTKTKFDLFYSRLFFFWFHYFLLLHTVFSFLCHNFRSFGLSFSTPAPLMSAIQEVLINRKSFIQRNIQRVSSFSLWTKYFP